MFDRKREGSVRGTTPAGATRRGLAHRPRLEDLEGRPLLATLAPIAPVTVPAFMGEQLPLDGGTGAPQTYTVQSDNPEVQATVAQGQFWTIGVGHTSSGPTDPAFTGTLMFQLFDDLTPLTTQRIESLINQGFYTSPTQPTDSSPPLPSKNFHRIASGFPNSTDFIVQGGSITGNGTGNVPETGYPFRDEFLQQLAFTGNGQLAMANAGPDTNDSQFFITTGMPRFLDYHHTIFGQLVAGQQILQDMTQVAKQSDGQTPVNPILFTASTLSNSSPDGVIHLNTVGAAPGQTANLTITARAADGTTTTQVVPVSVGPTATTNTEGTINNERPFISGIIPNQVVGAGQVDTFQIPAIDVEGDPLTFQVGGGPPTSTSGGTTTFAPVQNGTASVDSDGVVSVVPNAGFTGTINLLVGVRDQTDRTGQGVDNFGNYDTRALSLTVQNGSFVNLQPIARTAAAAVMDNTPATVTLQGDSANPQSNQTVTYQLLSQPLNGTVTNFNPTAGTFTYTPNKDFIGQDTLTYQVTDVGDPTPNMTSVPGVVTINVTGGQTSSVRLIDRVLIVTPPPRTDGGVNTIAVHQVAGNLQVIVNGVIDATAPAATDVDRIVVYGTKASDQVTIGPEVTTPATLNGGQGGVNTLTAGGGSTLEHGWFGFNTLQGSPKADQLIGRTGHVHFVKSGGNDELFAGDYHPLSRRHEPFRLFGNWFNTRPAAPTGTFYKFVGNRLVAVPTPAKPTHTIERQGPPQHGVVPVANGSTATTTTGTDSGSPSGSGSGTVTTAQARATRQQAAANRRAAATNPPHAT
jgi:cyclophilin family peptidyl-prolyl cis-trans isomerase